MALDSRDATSVRHLKTEIRETIGWLKAGEKSFDFCNNPGDAVYDTL
jgi:hypothetical protein